MDSQFNKLIAIHGIREDQNNIPVIRELHKLSLLNHYSRPSVTYQLALQNIAAFCGRFSELAQGLINILLKVSNPHKMEHYMMIYRDELSKATKCFSWADYIEKLKEKLRIFELWDPKVQTQVRDMIPYSHPLHMLKHMTNNKVRSFLTILLHKDMKEQIQTFHEFPFLLAKYYKHSVKKFPAHVRFLHMTNIDGFLHVMKISCENEKKQFTAAHEWVMAQSDDFRVTLHNIGETDTAKCAVLLHFYCLGKNSKVNRLRHFKTLYSQEELVKLGKHFRNFRVNCKGVRINSNHGHIEWNGLHDTIMNAILPHYDDPLIYAKDDIEEYLAHYFYDPHISTCEYITRKTNRAPQTVEDCMCFVYECAKQCKTLQDFLSHLVEILVYLLMKDLERINAIGHVIICLRNEFKTTIKLCVFADQISFVTTDPREIMNLIRKLYTRVKEYVESLDE